VCVYQNKVTRADTVSNSCRSFSLPFFLFFIVLFQCYQVAKRRKDLQIMLFMSKPAARIQKKQNGTIMMRAFEVKKKENQVKLK